MGDNRHTVVAPSYRPWVRDNTPRQFCMPTQWARFFYGKHGDTHPHLLVEACGKLLSLRLELLRLFGTGFRRFFLVHLGAVDRKNRHENKRKGGAEDETRNTEQLKMIIVNEPLSNNNNYRRHN